VFVPAKVGKSKIKLQNLYFAKRRATSAERRVKKRHEEEVGSRQLPVGSRTVGQWAVASCQSAVGSRLKA